jgi:adenosylhomocysteine nucleosidase
MIQTSLRHKQFRGIILRTGVLLLLLFSSIAQAGSQEPPRILVISAFDRELAKLLGEAQITKTNVINGRQSYVGTLAGKPVVLALSGINMVNAAITVQSLFDTYNISLVVFSGIAGGVNPSLHIGDVTVAEQWGSYQEQRFARSSGNGWDAGSQPGNFANFGMIFPRDTNVVSSRKKPDEIEKRFWFPVDANALESARVVASKVTLAACTADGACLDYNPVIVVGGNGVSGPTFVDNAEYRAYVWETFHAQALDSETAAVAIAAYVNQVPYIAFRSLSDLAGGDTGKNKIRIFGTLAAENSARVVTAFLKALPAPVNTDVKENERKK